MEDWIALLCLIGSPILIYISIIVIYKLMYGDDPK